MRVATAVRPDGLFLYKSLFWEDSSFGKLQRYEAPTFCNSTSSHVGEEEVVSPECTQHDMSSEGT